MRAQSIVDRRLPAADFAIVDCRVRLTDCRLGLSVADSERVIAICRLLIDSIAISNRHRESAT
jgi:hypothetical protein